MKTMFMKKIFLLGLMLASSIGLSAQDLNVCTKAFGEYGEVTVIKPTIANLLTLLSMSSDEFEAVMRKNKYDGRKMSDEYLAYWNGSNDNFAYAKAVNAFLYNTKKKEVHFSVSNEMVYPQGSIMALYDALKPYYKETLPGDGGRMGNAPGPRPGGPRLGDRPGDNARPEGNAQSGDNAQPGNQAQPEAGARPEGGFRPGDGPGRRGRRGLGGFGGRSRTDVYEVKNDSGTYIFSIGAFPRFFYVVVSKEE